jgi:hypothetical protein
MALELSASASTPVGNWGRSLSRIVGKKGAGGQTRENENKSENKSENE